MIRRDVGSLERREGHESMTVATAATLPVRLRPAPRFEPPYDDEFPRDGVGHGHRAGPYDIELPLDWRRESSFEGRPSRQRHAGRSRRGGTSHGGPDAQRMSPELRLTVRRFVDLYLEVLNQRRPLRHLQPLMTNETFNSTRLGLIRRGKTWWPMPVGRPPVRGTGRTVVTQLGERPAVIGLRRVRCCQPAVGVVEVAAVLHRAGQVRAVGFRLEQDDSGWLCTALEFVG